MLYLGLSVKPQKRLIGVFFRGLTGGNSKSQISNKDQIPNFKRDLGLETWDAREAPFSIFMKGST